jgi:hypothetical protein
LPSLKQFYCDKFGWSDNIFDAVDWNIFCPVYKKHIAKHGIQWMHKSCIKENCQRETECTNEISFTTNDVPPAGIPWEDNDHIFQCRKRKVYRKNIIKQTNILRNHGDPVLCDILKEGLLLTYFLGDCMTTAMLRIRRQQ